MSLLVCSQCEENRDPILNEFQKVQEGLGSRLRGFHPRIKPMNGHYDVGKTLGIEELNDILFTFQKAEQTGEYEISFHPAYRSMLKYYNKLLIIQMIDDYVQKHWINEDYLSLPPLFNDVAERHGVVRPKAVRNEFVSNCARFLQLLDCPPDYAQIAAAMLYDRMAANKLAYHNPIHVLCIFEFAKKHNIGMTHYDQLAIWFHDAVYDPHLKDGANELASAEFMRGILFPYINKHIVDVVFERIMATARHLAVDVDGLHYTVLDLDLCSFSFERPIYTKVAGYIRQEFSHVPMADFLKGRKGFLKAMLDKGFIYRSNEFKKFEAAAIANIEQDLKELENE